jgi:putative iron-dependent peroxidase
MGLGVSLKGLREFPAVAGPSVSFPSTQGALWTFVGGDDPGDTLHRARTFVEVLGSAVFVQEEVLAFKYAGGRDLSGYEDGTENPKGEKASAAALVSSAGAGLDGSSFVSVQRWVHDLSRLRSYAQTERDALVGRRQDTNEEIANAPASAHIKRTAQESYDPPAFMVRRSMPWGNSSENGLYFVAYGASFDAFERMLKRMAGLEDGIVDGLMRFTRAASGGYYWCPPLRGGRLDLSALGK